jgi:N-acylneuraminate cytidylyltransferase
MKTLFLIPARAGSKGVPRKNVRLLNAKPLIAYTLEAAIGVSPKNDICVSSDDMEVIEIAKSYGLDVPFVRPAHLASDHAAMHDVMLHTLTFYKTQLAQTYDALVLLQPTSPFRSAEHIREAMLLFEPGVEMVVSVCHTRANPYYVLYEENNHGWLEPSKKGNFTRRQDCPAVWELNGAIYVISVNDLLTKTPGSFTHIRKYTMNQLHSLDIDNETDWMIAECLMGKGKSENL